MEIEKDIHHINFDFKSGIMIHFWQTLVEVFTWKKFNWNTFQFILIEFEKDTMTGAYEFVFVLLCCGIRIRIPHKTDKGDEFWKRTKKSIDILKQSCYGWVNHQMYKEFKNKKRNVILLYRKRTNGFRKKLFLQ